MRGSPISSIGGPAIIRGHSHEVYLQVIFEILEDGDDPTRGEIVRRLGRAGPTVSEALTRLANLDLVSTGPGRQVLLTGPGQACATRVVRKHRLIELFLDEVVGLDWGLLHLEALRWQQVVSLQVETLLAHLVRDPSASPYGIPVPDLDGLLGGPPDRPEHPPPDPATARLDRFAVQGGGRAVVGYLTESGQSDPRVLADFRRAGIRPGQVIDVDAPARGADSVGIGSMTSTAALDIRSARAVRVRPIRPAPRPEPAAGRSPGMVGSAGAGC